MDIELNRVIEIAIYKADNPLTPGDESEQIDILINDESEVRIEAGSLQLSNSIVDTDIKFGQLISGEFRCTLFNLSTDVSGRKIKVWWIDTTNPNNRVEHEMFTGWIDSAEHDNVNKHRDIIAYDWAYYHRDINVADFWNTFWETNKTATTVRLDWFRSQLLDYLGIMGGAGSLYNDSLNIAGQYDKVTVLTFESLLIMISELQCAFPHINAGGALDFIRLDNTNTADLRSQKYEGDSSRWEDFAFQPISGIAIWEDSNNMLNVIGSDDNPYSISSNLFLLNMERADRDQICTALLTQMSGYSYIPCSINMIASDLTLELGQRIRTEKGYSYIMSNELFGSLFVEQTLECRATSGTLKLEGSTYNDNMVNGLKTAKIEKNIDELSIQYRNVVDDVTQLSTDISIMAGKIVLQVDGTGGVAAMRLDSTGSASEFAVNANQINLDGYDIVLNGTHGITITSPNFNVTSDGTIQAVKGLIGGLIIHNNNISTEDSGEYSVSQDEWEPWENVDGEGHNGYRSFSNWHENNKDATATISFEGYDTFVVVIRSDAEGRYDYTMASGIGVETFTRTSPYVGTTKGNQNANVVCTYSGLNGLATTIKILYTKDSSSYSGADRGYFYIDESACVRTSEASNFKLSATDFSRVINGQTRDHLRLAIGNKFGVNVDGTLYADIGEFNGSINVNNKFIVDSQGNMTAENGTLSGTIQSGTGEQYVKVSNGLITVTPNSKIQMVPNAEFASYPYDVIKFTQTGTGTYPSTTIYGAPLVLQGATSVSGVVTNSEVDIIGSEVDINSDTAINLTSTTGKYKLANLNTSGTKMLTINASGEIGVATLPPTITANPSGTASTALTKLTIGSTIYSVGGTNVVANPSGSASTELAKLTVGSTTYSVSRVSANPPLAGSTTLQRIQIDGTTYEMPSGGGGSVGQRVDVSPSPTLITVTNDTYKSIKRITLSKGTYLIQATVKFKDETDIQVGIGTENNTHDLQSRAYGSDKLSASRIIVNPNNTDMYVYIGVYCKGSSNIIKTGYNYGSGADVNDKTIIEYIKLND